MYNTYTFIMGLIYFLIAIVLMAIIWIYWHDIMDIIGLIMDKIKLDLKKSFDSNNIINGSGMINTWLQ